MLWVALGLSHCVWDACHHTACGLERKGNWAGGLSLPAWLLYMDVVCSVKPELLRSLVGLEVSENE